MTWAGPGSARRRSWAILLLAVLLQPVTGWSWLSGPAEPLSALREAFVCRPAGVDVELALAEKRTGARDAKLNARCDAAPAASAPRPASHRAECRRLDDQAHLHLAPALDQRPVRGPPSLHG